MGKPTRSKSSLVTDNYACLSQTLELSVSCSDLKTSGSAKLNALVAVYMQELGTNEFTERGRTEPVPSHSALEFADKIYVEHFFEDSAENLKFVVYQSSNPKKVHFSSQDILGEAMVSIGNIVKLPKKFCMLELINNRSEHKGKICIRAEVPEDCKDVAVMSWEGRKPDKGHAHFGRKLLKLKFSKVNEDRSFTLCLKSDPNKTKWTNLKVPVQVLCNADEDRTIKVQIYEAKHHEEDGILVGEFFTRFGKLKEGPGKINEYDCKREVQSGSRHSSKGSWETTAIFTLTDFRIEKQSTVFDYIQNGMEVSFVVGIDFTDSNGEYTDTKSLHYLHPDLDNLNDYELAIKSVGDVLEKYDTDERFPCFGFGARLPPDDKISHKFPISLTEDADCEGVDGILEAYRDCVPEVKFAGPTNLAPIIRHVAQQANRVQDGSNYYVLLILTDGVYSDRDATIEAIFAAAKTPMSIVIVGMGNENFSEMLELDGDDEKISYRGDDVERDIVQFVQLRDHLSADRSQIMNRGQFAKKVLEEIPEQIIDYMKRRNLSPGSGSHDSS